MHALMSLVFSFFISLSGAQNDLTAAGVLQHLLGATPHGYTKWGSNSTGAR